MDHKMKQASGTDSQQQQRRQQVHKTDDIVAEEEEEDDTELNEEIKDVLKQKTFLHRATQMMETVAGTRLGQKVFEKTDRVLKVLEETAKWGLTPDDHEMELQRPLPWILFLGLIVWLRAFRFCFSVVAYMVGLQPVTPKSMVYYLQTQRRRLRAIRVQGLKTLRSKEPQNADKTSPPEKTSLLAKLRELLNSAICKPGQRSEATATRHVFKQEATDDTDDIIKRSNKRPRHEESDLGDLTVSEMLDKFASEDSDNDSDYVPPDNEDADDDDDDSTTTTSHNTTASAEEADKYLEEKSANNRNDDLKDEIFRFGEVKENGTTTKHTKPKSVQQINSNDNHNNGAGDMEKMNTTKTHLNASAENGETKLMPWPTSAAEKTSTPNEAVSDDGASSCSPENQPPNQKKNFYHSSHNKHHTHHYYNAKNRNKNRH